MLHREKSYSEYYYVFGKNIIWAFGFYFCCIYFLFSKSDNDILTLLLVLFNI